MALHDDILKHFRAGHLDDFYKALYPSLLLFASRTLGTRYGYLSEDCVQESIYKTWQQREQITDYAELRAYVFAAVHNQAVSYVRRSTSKEQHATAEAAQSDTSTESLELELIAQETLDLVYAAIEKLPEDLHQLYDLLYLDGKKLAEAAEEMGISVSGIKKKKAKMLGMLREYLGPQERFLYLIIL